MPENKAKNTGRTKQAEKKFKKIRLPVGSFNAQRNSDDRTGKKKKQKRDFSIASFLVIVTVLIVGVLLSLTVFFHIEEIVIIGSTVYKDDDIIEVSGINKGDNLLLSDFSGASERLQRMLPYIYDVNFSRVFPGRITIEITEANPVCAVLTDDGQYLILDDSAKILEYTSEKPDRMCVLYGIDSVSTDKGNEIITDPVDTLLSIKQVMSALEESGITGIISVDFSNAINIVMNIENRFKVVLGTPNNAREKLVRLKKTMEKLSDSDAGTLDLTIENKVSYIHGPAPQAGKKPSDTLTNPPSSSNASSDDPASSETDGDDGDGDGDGDDSDDGQSPDTA